MGIRTAHPPHIRAAAVAAYGKRSMTLVAAELGVSTGAIAHWWAAARRDGTVEPLFGRFNGGSVRAGRVSLRRATGETYIEPAVSQREQRRLDASRRLEHKTGAINQ